MQVTFTNNKFTKTVPAQIVEGRNNMEAELTDSKDNKTFLTGIQLKDATLKFGDATHTGY